MPVLKPRNRVVVFRLTQDEYEDLKTVSSVRGARNISDFTRSELLTSIGQERRSETALQGKLSDVDQKLSNLESKIQRMSQLLERMVDRK
jgi:hypothetical protein